MAAVHQEPTAGQEPNAHSTPARSRNTRVILMVLAVLIVLAIAAAVLLARQPGTNMGGSLSEERPAAGPANATP